jgi:hypothetical protein
MSELDGLCYGSGNGFFQRSRYDVLSNRTTPFDHDTTTYAHRPAYASPISQAVVISFVFDGRS